MRLLTKKVFNLSIVVLLLTSLFTPAAIGATVERPIDEATILERFHVQKPTRETTNGDINVSQLGEKESEVSKDTLIIKYEKPISIEQHRKLGTSFQKRIRQLNYDIVKINPGKTLEDVVMAYKKLDTVVSIAPSIQVKTLSSLKDPKEALMYHLDHLNIDKALELMGDHEVVVGVIDTGLDPKNPDLKNQILRDYNVGDPLKRGVPHAHSTHVSGIIAAEAGNGIGGKGVNPYAKILPIDVFSGGSNFDFNVAEALLYAIDQEVDVINMSIGTYYPSPIMGEAVQKAIDAGIVVVAAAGNDFGQSIYNYPASYPGVITVGATNDQKESSYFSTVGPSIDLVAPGEDVYSSIFDYQKHATFGYMSGTSMASPIVAGVASLLLSKNPDLTPYEVKYILEKTATDLGEKGYDTTYGYGLVNPVAALQYDVTNLPSEPEYNLENLYEFAHRINFNDYNETYIHTNAITVPGQEDWVRFDLNKGDTLQIILDGHELYDYEMLFNVKSINNREFTVSDVKEGTKEGYLFEATERSNLFLAVRDKNGKYDETGNAKYHLIVTKYEDLNEDTNTATNQTVVDKFPYSSLIDENGPYFLTGKDGNSDYFRFSFDESKVVQINLEDLPGVQTSLRLYYGEEFDLYSDQLDNMPQQEYDRYAYDYHYYGPYPIASSNRNGIGQGEALVFNVEAGIEYVLEVTNKFNYFFDPYYFFYYDWNMDIEARSSNLPYELTIIAETLPEDEDGYPMAMYDRPIFDKEMEIEETIEYHKNAEEIFYKYIDYYYYYGDQDPEMMFDIAQPLEQGTSAKGYFQYQGDIDLFVVEPTVNGIFKFSFENKETLRPNLEILVYDSEQGYLRPIANSNNYNDPFMPYPLMQEEEVNVYVGLKEGEKYLLMFNNGYSPSLEQYKLKAELLVENPQDEFWEKHTKDEAQPLPKGSFKGNLALANEIDVFYFKAEQNGTYGLLVENVEPTTEEKEGLPDELFSPLYTAVIIFEDIDGNRELDDEEMATSRVFYSNWSDPTLRGSFKAEKDKNYIVYIMNDYYFSNANLTEYRMTLAPVNQIIKPALSFNQLDINTLITEGFFTTHNSTSNAERHKLYLEKASTLLITAEVPADIDGVISVYDEVGNLIKQADYYGRADAELLQLKLDQGTYYIQVTDYYGHGSIEPYKLKVERD